MAFFRSGAFMESVNRQFTRQGVKESQAYQKAIKGRAMYVVTTRVRLKPGAYKQCANLFKSLNPGLVEGEPNWLGTRMIFDPVTDIVTVFTTWKDVSVYRRLRESPEFKDVMQAFAPHFAGPPDISLNKVLVDMVPQPDDPPDPNVIPR